MERGGEDEHSLGNFGGGAEEKRNDNQRRKRRYLTHTDPLLQRAVQQTLDAPVSQVVEQLENALKMVTRERKSKPCKSNSACGADRRVPCFFVRRKGH